MNYPDALVNELSGILATEQCGLVSHIAASTPYVSPQTYKLFAAFKAMAKQGVDHARRITQFMQKYELQPNAVTFGVDVANYHFMDLKAMLPELVAEKQLQIAAYQRAIEHLSELPDACKELNALLEENGEQLDQLESAM